MRFTPDMATAFGDWLELDLIRRALVAARPELDDAMVLDDERPLLRIPHPSRGMVMVARMADSEAAAWAVGAPGTSSPMVHELDSVDAVVARALSLLARPHLGQDHEEHPGQTRPSSTP